MMLPFLRSLGLFCSLVIGVPVSLVFAATPDFEIISVVAITDDSALAEHPVVNQANAGIPVVLDFVVAPGEYEPASFLVQANSSLKDITIRPTVLTDSADDVLEGASLDIRIVKRWYQRNFGFKSPQTLKYMMSELLVYDDSLIRVEDGKNFLRFESGEYI
jgi:hypothetical protein